MHLSEALFYRGNLHHLQFYFYGLLIFIATSLECLAAIFLLMYAKMALVILLVLAPVFLLFLLWDTLRIFFNQWLGQLFNYAFIPLVTCGILMLTLSLAQATQPGSVNEKDFFSGIMVYLCVSFITVFLFLQVMSICAALSSGVALEGLKTAIPLGKKMAIRSGASWFAKKGGYFAHKGYTAAKKRLSSKPLTTEKEGKKT